jgi:hypothetical protein
MKKLVALLLVSMMATVAFAGLDPDTDSMGVYFDLNGDTNCLNGAPGASFAAYMLLMNPASSTNGFECVVTMAGTPGSFFVLATDLGAGALDVDSTPDGYAVGAASPYTGATALRLIAWNILPLGAGPIDFFIRQANIPSVTGGVPAVTGDGILRRCGVASGNVDLPVASWNGGCPVSEEVSSFGNVKSLFR